MFAGVPFDAQSSPQILLEMWEKWVFIATLAGSTCLMRATIGDISSAPGGQDFVLRLLEECRTVAAAAGFPTRPESLQRARDMFTVKESPLTASMLRDMETKGPIEADHIIGDLLNRSPGTAPILAIVYTALKAYESKLRRPAHLSAGR